MSDRPKALRCGETPPYPKSRQTGKPCRQWPRKGRQRCKDHGGTHGRGCDSPHWKGKGTSRYLPTRLADLYQQSKSDPDRISLDRDIAQAETRIAELNKGLDEAPATEIWDQVGKTFQALRAANARGDTEGAVAYYRTLEGLITKGQQQGKVWAELGDWLEIRGKAVEREYKRLQAKEGVTATEMLIAIGQIKEVILRHVTDRSILAAIGRDIAQLGVEGDG